MTRWTALASAAVVILLVGAQDVVPAWPGFHTWQYAGVLAILMISLLSYAGSAAKGRDGESGFRLLLVAMGALIVGAAGMASGLLGPDTVTIARAPGTVVPLPDLGVAAFFPNVEATEVTEGRAAVVLRRRNGPSIALESGARHFLGSYVLENRPEIAAYIDVLDRNGNHLTVTQPTGAAFLSPVLLFPTTVQLDGQTLPADTFAVPALHRRVQAMYFSPEVGRTTRVHQMVGDRAALLFAADDDGGRLVPGGLGLAAGGMEATVGGLNLRPALGRYPALIVSAVPATVALRLGVALIVAGLLWVGVSQALPLAREKTIR